MPQIETERLLLRPYQLQDFDRFYAMLRDPIAKQHTGGITQMTYDQRLAVFQQDLLVPFSDAQTEFAIADKATSEYLGYCGFITEDGGGPEFLYGLCRDSWGKGYGYEAARAVLSYCFAHYGHDRYIATVEPENAASIGLLKKLGFTVMGDHFAITRADFVQPDGI